MTHRELPLTQWIANCRKTLTVAVSIGVMVVAFVCAPSGMVAEDATHPVAEVDWQAKVAMSETRDVFLLLDRGPVHLRFHLSVAGKSPEQARRDSVAAMLAKLDADGDGKLSRSEAQRSPLFREKQRPQAEAFIKSIGADLSMNKKSLEQQFERLGGETVVYRQNTMTSDSDTEVFRLLDADANNLIEPSEMGDAISLLLAQDRDDDECVTLDEFAPVPANNGPVINGLVTPPRVTAPTVAELLRDSQQALLPQQLLSTYDANRDRKLIATELGWSDEQVAACDNDGDGKLGQKELMQLSKGIPAATVWADVVQPTDGTPMLQVLKAESHLTAAADLQADRAKLMVQGAIVSIGVRPVDPFEASMALAMRTFNELDQDNNGYLDAAETMLRERFGRGLFDQIDADGDAKIFGEEMREFIRARGEPVASSCTVVVFDDGAGFFSALDSNGDRRLSMREMMHARDTLSGMEHDNQPGLAENEPARHYRIELARSVFNPFGGPERAQPAINAGGNQNFAPTASRGPVWFQRWDRNNDGDITWREFLGPRDAFDKLDVDGDGMIDSQEAARAGSLTQPGNRAARPSEVSPSRVTQP